MRYNGSDITTVWIDLDDTLIDFHKNSRVALEKVYADRRLDRVFASCVDWIECYEKHNKRLWQLYSAGEVTQDFLRVERFTRPLIEGGMDPEEALRLSHILDPLYLDFLAREKALIPGAGDLLRFFRNCGVRIGVLSNGFREVQYRKIDSAGLTDLIDVVVLSDDIGINKPDVRIYHYAMERVTDTNPRHHLMIGDNLQTDIRGALDAGWHAIHFDPSASSATPSTVNNLDQIPLIFAQT